MSFKTATSLASFWIKEKAEYPELMLKTLLQFPSMYLCENAISTLNVQEQYDIHSLLYVELSSIESKHDKLPFIFYISNSYLL